MCNCPVLIICSGCSIVSRGGLCGDGPRCPVDWVCHCGQGSRTRYIHDCALWVIYSQPKQEFRRGAIQTKNKADKRALRYGHWILRWLTAQSSLQNSAVFVCVVLILLCVWLKGLQLDMPDGMFTYSRKICHMISEL